MATTIIPGVQYSGIWNLNSQNSAQAATTWPIPNAYLYSWGVGNTSYGGSGSLGLNNGSTNYSSPKQVGSLATWSKLSPGSNENAMFLINSSGQLFGVGANGNGRLGDNTSIDRSSPVQIGSGTTWAQATSAFSGSAAIKTDGTLWTWGSNNEGGSGQNDAIARSSPTQVGSLTNWRKVVGGGGSGLVAIKTDGTLWGWGPNGDARLGDNTVISRSSPVQIGSDTTWSDVDYGDYNVAAIKTDGSLWVWGVNTYGNLGLNLTTVAVRSSPVQLGSEYNWASVAVGNAQMLARKSDGTIWGWGENFGGQIGQNDAIPRSSPVQIGALTSWSKLESGARFVHAIKEGTLWAWGYNGGDALYGGRLGTNTHTNISSPTQVGSLSTWVDVAGGGVQGYGISSV